MAEEGSVYESEGIEEQLQSLLSRYSSDELRADSKPFCSDFCKLVEENASRWQVPRPQLRILETSLRYFTRASTFFATNCDHVFHTLSSLALSVFELLLFFDQKDFHEEPLKRFTDTFQECHLSLARHQNVHLLQVERLVRGSGPWANPALQAILSESSLPQSEVDEYISSELPVFFELRVRYLLSSEQRVSEAVALAKCCARHPSAGQHLFFLQVYLTWLLKTSQHDSLHREVADLNGKDAIHIICSLESEEKDELLLALSRAFLSQQLCRGDMSYLCDLVFIWSKLHSRLKTSKPALLEESHQLMLSATNVNPIFPFIRAIMQELGEDGIQFCVELCANALESCLPCDVITKSLIYKTIAGLLPSDLEVCRACALLVFFLERSIEAYKMVYLLYMHPDQEYNVESSPIRNHVRFETLQVLKKDLYFDPEFWNLIALRTNCLKLMNEKVVSAALEEIMEDKWILKYCTKESALRSSTQKDKKGAIQAAAKKRHHKEDTDIASKRLKTGPGRARLNVDNTGKKRGNQGSRPFRDASKPLRRSFWQLDRLQDNVAFGSGELRRTTRLSEKNPPKRRIRKPRWLLEDSGTLEGNNVPSKIKRHGLKHEKPHQSSVIKRGETGQFKNSAKHRPSVNPHLMERENSSKLQKELSSDSVRSANPPQVILELSLPDNELMGTFIEETCNRQRGFPQVLLYRPTVKVPAAPQPLKTMHRKEVVLRARDPAMFIQQLHCYARRQKGKGNGPNMQGSVSTITRSSVQGSPPKEPQRRLREKVAAETKVGIASQAKETLERVPQTQTIKAVLRKTSSAKELSDKSALEMKDNNALRMSAGSEVTEAPLLDKVLQSKSLTTARELCEGSAVEMKVTIASQTPTAIKASQPQGLDKVSKSHTVKDASKTTTSAEVLQTSTVDNNPMVPTDERPNTGAADLVLSQSQDAFRNLKQDVMSTPYQTESCKRSVVKADTPEMPTNVSNGISEMDVIDISTKLPKGHENDTTSEGSVVTVSKTKATYRPTDPDGINDISALTLVTEMVTELSPEKLARDLENQKPAAPENGASKESKAGSKPKVPHKLQTTSSSSIAELEDSDVSDLQGKKEGPQDYDSETPEDGEAIETEESRLVYCCTFCNKVFKGSRVVAHAMFHYRKDECMFCGTMFKDDLLAMMHLSDHIEKLKRSKDTSSNNAQENLVSETKDISSAKAKTTNVRGRPRKSSICPKSMSLPDSTPSGSRKLRSNDKPVDGPSLQEKKQSKDSKHINSKFTVHKVNGHIGKKKKLGRPRKVTLNLEAKQEISQERRSNVAENPRLQGNKDVEVDSATSAQNKEFCRSTEGKMKEMESLQVQKTTAKQDGKSAADESVDHQERVCCPVEGCAWFTDLSKNRVALLYHAMEDHHGEIKPLKLAFRIGNGKCSVCMRVLWSFEHFQHHVERHRLTPRYPCPHQGCPFRFKTGMEMRRHARRHSPLQAACCLPGCSQLFICLWALNLHEREHYASKPSKPDKNSNEPTVDKHSNTPAGKKQPDHKPKDTTATTTVKRTVSAKALHKLRRQNTRNSKEKRVKAPPRTSARASLVNQKLKDSSETNVLKNLSNKDTSAQPSGPTLRLRQTLRKVKATKTTLGHKIKGHKILPSSLFKHNIKVRHKLNKMQAKVNIKGQKRRGRPPKSKKVVHDENNTTGHNNETVTEENARQKHQKSADQPTSPTKAAEATNEIIELNEESPQVQDVVKTTETSIDKEDQKNVQIRKNHVKQKESFHRKTLNQSVATTSADKTQKSTGDKIKKLHKAKRHTAPKENKSENIKVTNSNANTEIIKKKCPLKESEPTSTKPVESKSVLPQAEAKAAVENPADEEGKVTDSTQDKSVDSVPANSLNEIAAPSTSYGEKPQKVATEKSNISHITKQKGKKEKKNPASSDSGKRKKQHKDANTKGDKKVIKLRRPCKDGKKKAKSVEQMVEAKDAAESSPDVEGQAKDETANATLDSSGSSIPAATTSSLNEMTSPPTVGEEKTPKVTNKEKSKKSHDPNKARKKRKDAVKEGDKKIVKRKRKDQCVLLASKKSKTSQVQPVGDVRAEGMESSVRQEEKTSQSTARKRGHSAAVNGQEVREEAKAVEFKQNLAEYGKRPYMRPPPEAYLDEKYITMPKRRKETPASTSSQRNPSPEQAKVTAALQRQRCANCFATFNTAEDLQSHLQLQKCSNLFGFDSDDEGNS
uniref:uncharacterized protein n=1 Tax=Semicossyphus pulcher TaxID=241346 RepID=UPI0037E7317C